MPHTPKGDVTLPSDQEEEEDDLFFSKGKGGGTRQAQPMSVMHKREAELMHEQNPKGSSPPQRARQHYTHNSAFPEKDTRNCHITPDLGLVFERTDGSGLFVVKRLVKGSMADADGRVNVNDTLLKVS